MNDLDIEILLRDWGKYLREQQPTDTEIDDVLARAPEITLSENFRERALAVMREAQEKRKRRKDIHND